MTSKTPASQIPTGVSPAWKDMAEACSSLMMENMQKSWEFQTAFLTSKTPEEAITRQTEILQDMMARYAEETSRWVTMMTGTVAPQFAMPTQSRSRAYNDVPV